MTALRAILIDDHPLFRKGLAELLEHSGEIRVVGVTGSLHEARALLAERPDVLVMDLHMPGGDGIEAIRQLREEGVELPIVALTVSDSEEDMARALRAGARGYLLKSMEPDEVIEAIARAVRGEVVVAPAMTAKLLALLEGKSVRTSSLMDQLTQREREILACLAGGKSNKAIARELHISADTVKLHVRNVLAKLNLSSRVEAAVFAVRHDIDAGRGVTDTAKKQK
ncbi:MAG: response regulator [Betaproteobacteria bacterium]|nr:response regulator [Betaproteobacteria bacterium]